MNKYTMLLLVLSLSAFVFVAKSFSQDNQDPKPWTDYETKCQYLITKEGGISPRMVDNGVIYMHMGCKPLVVLPQVKMK